MFCKGLRHETIKKTRRHIREDTDPISVCLQLLHPRQRLWHWMQPAFVIGFTKSFTLSLRQRNSVIRRDPTIHIRAGHQIAVVGQPILRETVLVHFPCQSNLIGNRSEIVRHRCACQHPTVIEDNSTNTHLSTFTLMTSFLTLCGLPSVRQGACAPFSGARMTNSPGLTVTGVMGASKK